MQIIFDLDGTLFKTADCEIAAIDNLCKEFAYQKIPDKEITSNIGKKTSDFLLSLFSNSIDLDQYTKRFRELEHIEISNHGQLFPDAENMLKTLKACGHHLCICSNGSLEYINLVLERTKIDSYFTEIISAKDFSSKVEAIAKIIENNKDSILVGDTNSDIVAAKENLIPSIGVEYGYGKKEDILKATFIVHNPMEIVTSVNQCKLFYEIMKKISLHTQKIVGINGVDTSGKTILTNLFSRFLRSLNIKTEVLHIDDFHNPLKIRTKGDNKNDAYYNNAFNYTQLIQDVLIPLKENTYLDKTVTCLDLDSDKYEKLVHYTIDKDTVLLIEGVLLFREPLINFIDVKIFLYIDFAEVLERAKQRDVPKYGESFLQKYIDKYIPIQKKYIEECKPQEISDILINNNDYQNPVIV